jgi:hypothetical protein
MVPTATVVVIQLRETAGYKGQASGLLMMFNSFGSVGGKFEITGAFSIKTRCSSLLERN